MNIGFVGLGKLGLPCALAMSVLDKSTVYGYDLNPNIQKFLHDKKVPYIEKDIDYYLKNGKVELLPSIKNVVEKSDIVFVAVQTPHEERFDGTYPIGQERKDFDYSFLLKVLNDIRQSIIDIDKKSNTTISIISTVLPGTFKKYIYKIFYDILDRITLVYNPYFIAMGTTIEDFTSPEFILVGHLKRDKRLIDEFNDERPILMKFPHDLINFYKKILPEKNIVNVEIESAETIKISYNTFIGFKIIFGNLIGEISEKIGGDADEVISTLALANKRIMSPQYLWQGFADGGACHPRDHIAMSWFAKEHNLSTDIFEYITKAREKQVDYWAKFLVNQQKNKHQKIYIMGAAYKKNIGLLYGSPTLLLEKFLKQYGADYYIYDPLVLEYSVQPEWKEGIYFIAIPHDIFSNFLFPTGAVIYDPFSIDMILQYGVWRHDYGRL